MIEVFYIGQYDTLPAYRAVVRDHDGIVNLSDVTAAYFLMTRISTASMVVSALASVVGASSPASTTDSWAMRYDWATQYSWSVADTMETGEFSAAFLFVTAAGEFTLPRNQMAKVVVEDRTNLGDS